MDELEIGMVNNATSPLSFWNISPKSVKIMINSTYGKLVVWVGGLDIWDPLMTGIVT